MRLIDADALEKRIDEFLEGVENANYVKENWMCVVDEQPTIEAEPVKHGRWKIKAINEFELSYGTIAYEPVYQCSECGGVEESYLRLDEPIMPEDANFPRYCPWCGARQDLEVEENG